MRPLFIVVEGIDGAGTTTCSKLLAERMRGPDTPVLWTKQPSDGTIGRHIRRILKGEEAADELGMFPLFLADRHDHVASIIRPHLDQGETVICDRYAYSTWVYQQDNYDPFLIEYMHRKVLAPHYVFVLAAPVEECARRLSDREFMERYEVLEKQEEYYMRYFEVPALGTEKKAIIGTLNNPPEKVVDNMLAFIEEHERIGYGG